ncbi:MAG: leucine-rich repeat domain-containing protein, partial [Oscillospiraceae bacterium]
LASRLSKEKASLDLSSSGVKDFKGLQLLTGLKALNLNNAGFNTLTIENSIKQINDYISKLTQLENLNLSNNNLKDADLDTSGKNPTPTNGIWVPLLKLVNLTTIDISNNSFLDLRGIIELPKLEKIYLYNNHQTQEGYGSKGTVNIYQGYVPLLERKPLIEIYNENAQTPYKIVIENDPDYLARRNILLNIRYQKKLPTGVPISNIWLNGTTKLLSDSPIDYDVPILDRSIKQGDAITQQDRSATIVFSPLDDPLGTATSFIMTYTYYVGVGPPIYGGAYIYTNVEKKILTLTFPVERIASY